VVWHEQDSSGHGRVEAACYLRKTDVKAAPLIIGKTRMHSRM